MPDEAQYIGKTMVTREYIFNEIKLPELVNNKHHGMTLTVIFTVQSGSKFNKYCVVVVDSFSFIRREVAYLV